LKRLRRAVYEWGRRISRGRFRSFDARMLAAINGALGDTDSADALTEPMNGQLSGCEISCVGDGGVFRLRGQAPFDVVFGYGLAGLGLVAGSAHMGPAAQQTLFETVSLLNWDLRRLQDERFRAVRNALFGLPLKYGVIDGTPSAGPAVDVRVHFQGPFSAVDDGRCRCLFKDQISKRTGVYLWTLNVAGRDRPYYLGQTRVGFGARMAQHLACMLSGEYPTYDIEALLQGEYRRAVGALQGEGWPQMLPSVLAHYETLMPHVIR